MGTRANKTAQKKAAKFVTIEDPILVSIRVVGVFIKAAVFCDDQKAGFFRHKLDTGLYGRSKGCAQ